MSSEFEAALPHIPDNLSIPQFILDTQHAIRPSRPPQSPWVIEDATSKKVGYEELQSRVRGLANALSSRWNIGENDVVCLFSPNHIDYPVALWAVHRLGGVVTPSNPAYTVDELVYQLELTKAKLVITTAAVVETASAAARKVGLTPDRIILLTPEASQHCTVDTLVREGLSQKQQFRERTLTAGEGKTKLALLSFSSGTTGKPKAVAITHYAVIANIIQMAVHQKGRFQPGDVSLAVLPFFHIYGLVVTMHYSLFCGATVTVIDKFSFLPFLKSITRHRITHLFLVPPHAVLLCKHPAAKDFDLSHVKYCMSGAAPLSAELTAQLLKVIPNASVGQGYGMTETCTSISMYPVSQHIGTVGSAGEILPGIEFRVLKEDGQLAGPGEPGELMVKGPSNALGYFLNEKATKETFIDGWVRTGDEVIIKGDREIYIVDRLKEIMKVNGSQVSPAELEGLLLDHQDVADVCVVGIPDEFSGEVPMAYVVISPKTLERVGSDAQALTKLKTDLMLYVAERKISYKHLKDVEFVPTIPKNPSGKLLRRVMRDMAKASRETRKARL
ncbi:phenylacetyl-CoA ligase [Athelia psychrophila]|uniref:Phenylacetyl-CoA ligase n=1 Tax=Athelia psychrophila TaxID=1759441 RepID=A0A166TZ03_9AGAM|nr:phenylacetyl-CoA ligase [Fibularhizoctonia sp. CBS 109695]